MPSMHVPSAARGWRALAAPAAVCAALAIAGVSADRASACTTGGSGCLPGLGYTIDRVWNCGAIAPNTPCYYDATTNPALATAMPWGWGSASYGGSGSVPLCMYAGTSFSACGTNLARGCFYTNCNAQSVVNLIMDVENYSGFRHTISGHAKA